MELGHTIVEHLDVRLDGSLLTSTSDIQGVCILGMGSRHPAFQLSFQRQVWNNRFVLVLDQCIHLAYCLIKAYVNYELMKPSQERIDEYLRKLAQCQHMMDFVGLYKMYPDVKAWLDSQANATRTS